MDGGINEFSLTKEEYDGLLAGTILFVKSIKIVCDFSSSVLK